MNAVDVWSCKRSDWSFCALGVQITFHVCYEFKHSTCFNATFCELYTFVFCFTVFCQS